MTKKERKVLLPPLQQQILRCRLLLKTKISAVRMWEELLSPEDQAFLGGDLTKCYKSMSTVGVWMRLRSVSELRATVDLAKDLDYISAATHKWLLRETGEAETSGTRTLPSWNRNTGDLLFGSRAVRRITSPKRATNIVPILDAFEQEGWPDKIDDPLPGGADPQRLREAVRTLNQSLETIRFRADGTGSGIVWEAGQTRATPAPRP